MSYISGSLGFTWQVSSSSGQPRMSPTTSRSWVWFRENIHWPVLKKSRKRKTISMLWLFYRLRLFLEGVDDVEELLFQFLFLWLINQLLICFSCKPVSWTSFALSSSYNSKPNQESKTALENVINKLYLLRVLQLGMAIWREFATTLWVQMLYLPATFLPFSSSLSLLLCPQSSLWNPIGEKKKWAHMITQCVFSLVWCNMAIWLSIYLFKLMLQFLLHTFQQRSLPLCWNKWTESHHAIWTVHASIKHVHLALYLIIIFIIRHCLAIIFTWWNTYNHTQYKIIKTPLKREEKNWFRIETRLPVMDCSDCSISQQAVIASIAWTQTWCWSCSLNEHKRTT